MPLPCQSKTTTHPQLAININPRRWCDRRSKCGHKQKIGHKALCINHKGHRGAGSQLCLINVILGCLSDCLRI